MRIKTKLSIIALFSCCAVASMGFASWVITQQGPVNGVVDGGISADNVVVSNNYVYINSPEDDIVSFMYSSKGFIDRETQKPTNTPYVGKMFAVFTVNLDRCSIVATDGSLPITIDLKLTNNANTGLFTNNRTSVSCDDSYVMVENCGYRYESNSYSATLTLSNLTNGSGTATFKLEYTFNLTNAATFQSNILDVFGDGTGDANFVVKAEFSFSISMQIQ